MGVDANPLGAVSAPPLTSVGFDARRSSTSPWW